MTVDTDWKPLATASEEFGIPVRTLRTMYYSGDIAHTVVRRRVFLDLNELRRLFHGQAARRVDPPPPKAGKRANGGGTVAQRGGRWRAQYSAPDGKRRSATFDTRAAAEAWLSTNRADVVRDDPRPTHLEPHPMTTAQQTAARLLTDMARAVLARDEAAEDPATLLIVERCCALARQAHDCRTPGDWAALRMRILTISPAGLPTARVLRDQAYDLANKQALT